MPAVPPVTPGDPNPPGGTPLLARVTVARLAGFGLGLLLLTIVIAVLLFVVPEGAPSADPVEAAARQILEDPARWRPRLPSELTGGLAATPVPFYPPVTLQLSFRPPAYRRGDALRCRLSFEPPAGAAVKLQPDEWGAALLAVGTGLGAPGEPVASLLVGRPRPAKLGVKFDRLRLFLQDEPLVLAGDGPTEHAWIRRPPVLQPGVYHARLFLLRRVVGPEPRLEFIASDVATFRIRE